MTIFVEIHSRDPGMACDAYLLAAFGAREESRSGCHTSRENSAFRLTPLLVLVSSLRLLWLAAA